MNNTKPNETIPCLSVSIVLLQKEPLHHCSNFDRFRFKAGILMSDENKTANQETNKQIKITMKQRNRKYLELLK